LVGVKVIKFNLKENIKVRKTTWAFGLGAVAGAVLRGGNWNNDVNAGVFAANLNNAPTNTNTNIGFRCVFVPCLWIETRVKNLRVRSERVLLFHLAFWPLGNFSLSLLGHAKESNALFWDLKVGRG
jgi:hypothetical protein